ncbi:MAG: DUF86 domain-containing protein [Candidatus Aquicultor sp.]|nr:DUF86 domain-containing protein [Candidatus Aquicultor sp.]
MKRFDPDIYDSFVKLGEQDMVPMEFASKIAPSSGLRSRLVHEYDRIDDAIAHASTKVGGIKKLTPYRFLGGVQLQSLEQPIRRYRLCK